MALNAGTHDLQIECFEPSTKGYALPLTDWQILQMCQWSHGRLSVWTCHVDLGCCCQQICLQATFPLSLF